MFAAFAILLSLAPLAAAKPGDPDTSFGSGGFVKLAAGDRWYSVGAPLTQAGGRTVFAGLLKSQADKLFLAAVKQDGSTDTTFGSAGETQTGVLAIQRKAATALAPDGKILVAGGSATAGTLTVERYTANGALDTSWGSAGKLSVNLGGTYARATAIAPTATGAFITAEATSGGRQVFTVVKLGPQGPDNSFGSGGIARVTFANLQATAKDVAVLPDGKVLLAGAVRKTVDTAKYTDTGLARLTPTGATDTTFGGGTGQIVHNIAGSSIEDYAAAIAPLADGRTVVTGPANNVGMVARVKPDGTLDSTFGSGGKVVGGLMYCCYDFAPADVVVDSSGRPIVTGSKTYGSPLTTRWGVMRLTPNASPLLDTTFGTSGRYVPSACENTAGAGPSGVALDGSRILVLGGCDSTARTTLARLGTATGPPAGPVDLTVSPSSQAAGHERIPLSSLDPSAALKAAEDAQAAAMRRTAMRRTAMRRTDIASTAMRRTAMRRTGLLSAAMRRTGLRYALLSEIALKGTSWEALLGSDIPLQTLTLEDAYAINPSGVGALTLDQIDLNSTAMRRTSLAALVLGVRPLSALPAPSGGWCEYLTGQPYNCSNGASTANDTLVDLETLGDDLSSYYDEPISLTHTDLGTGDTAAPLADFRLADLDLTIAPFKSADAGDFAPILACGTCANRKLSDLTVAERGNATIAQLVARLPQPSLQDLSVGDVILAMLDRSEIPYESLDLGGLLGEAEYRADGLESYRASFTVDCSQGAELTARLNTPGDARPTPDGAAMALDGGTPKALGKGSPAQGKDRALQLLPRARLPGGKWQSSSGPHLCRRAGLGAGSAGRGERQRQRQRCHGRVQQGHHHGRRLARSGRRPRQGASDRKRSAFDRAHRLGVGLGLLHLPARSRANHDFALAPPGRLRPRRLRP